MHDTSSDEPRRNFRATTIDTAIVHDCLTQRGGAERVVFLRGRVWPSAPHFTSLRDPAGTFPEFVEREIHTSTLNHLRPPRSRHRLALPLRAPPFSAVRVDAEVAVCSLSG